MANCDCMSLRSERMDAIGREWCRQYFLYVDNTRCNKNCPLYLPYPKTPPPACCRHFFSEEELKHYDE